MGRVTRHTGPRSTWNGAGRCAGPKCLPLPFVSQVPGAQQAKDTPMQKQCPQECPVLRAPPVSACCPWPKHGNTWCESCCLCFAWPPNNPAYDPFLSFDFDALLKPHKIWVSKFEPRTPRYVPWSVRGRNRADQEHGCDGTHGHPSADPVSNLMLNLKAHHHPREIQVGLTCTF